MRIQLNEQLTVGGVVKAKGTELEAPKDLPLITAQRLVASKRATELTVTIPALQPVVDEEEEPTDES